MQHDDIDLEARLITVQRGRQGTTKSGKVRHVPPLDSGLDVLLRPRLKRRASPLVFSGKGGGARAQTPVTCAFKAALRRAQMDKSLVWHALRHTGASWWGMSGGDRTTTGSRSTFPASRRGCSRSFATSAASSPAVGRSRSTHGRAWPN